MKSVLPQKIAKLAERVVAENRAAGRTIATAESCTGGLVAAAITEVPGSSSVLDSGFVTYSNEAKMRMLGVNADILDTFGAVSVAVAWAMAQGALKRSGADIAVAISGIAGPDGGTEKKPVGTVVFAVAEKGKDAEDMVGDKIQFGSDKSRADIRSYATLHALGLLLPPAP
ncbi:CinA family protein [Sphingorhabdus sp. IMCC26285]|jgi:nicotinamide-nucleotide amidase|uniref:CinA family protein n=1 Tax=Sphingorhabdus profundilacus TaxID=2509718 RepID=A0A6I4LVN4_9SPHN|nr:CinA family protein [Sphingorhabdus profundilacus]MVZ96919.1 CinA family protein [Sphingorhabdus profundilacus]